MLKSLALRRVLIYFALSSAGVAVVSQLIWTSAALA